MRELLPLFPKPSHYAGIEDGVVIKDPAAVALRVALAYPDTYEVGMSYLGHKILYNIINSNPGWQAERAMAPEREAAEILRRCNVPLATLETDTPLNEMSVIGFAVTHELCYTDVLHMLDLAHIPLRSADRDDDLGKCPLIIAGGGAMMGAEPLSPFIDLAALGDGEELLPEILTLLENNAGIGRSEFLLKARHIPGVYVPAFFDADGAGRLTPRFPGYRPARRIVSDLNQAAYPVKQVVPVGAVHNRLSLEIARGCSRGCRFCHAGIVYRPSRERSLENIAGLLNEALEQTGFEEISFLALSAGDFSAFKSLWSRTFERCAREQVTLSLPSLRVGSVDDSIMAKMASLRRAGCTLAPEAGSQRLRDVINKGVTEEELILHAQKLLEHGWRQVKLYFMIGLPTETDADLAEIAELCRKVRDAGGRGAPRLQVTAALSPFVPKPFTPFQWEAQIGLDEMRRRINFVRALFKGQKFLKLRWHEPAASHLEGLLSRAGRDMADVVEKAYRKGAIFCGWMESFTLDPWLEALAECGISAESLIGPRAPEQPLPWSHLEAGVSVEFLLRERKRAYENKTSADCRYGPCLRCGACDIGDSASLLPHAHGAERHMNRLVFKKRDQEAYQPARDEHGVIILKDWRQEPPRLSPAFAVKAAQYKIWHAKTGGCAFLSQLELQAILERCLRRANAPLAFSQGFHPMPLLTFGRALPVGVASEVEWLAVTLREFVPPQKLKDCMNRFLAADLAVRMVEIVNKDTRSEQAVSETFKLLFNDESLFAGAAECFSRFAALDEFMYERQTKRGVKVMDIRPLLLKWNCRSAPDGGAMVTFAADWHNEYLSPLALALAILKPIGGTSMLLQAMRLVKIKQTFANGNEYEHMGMGSSA